MPAPRHALAAAALLIAPLLSAAVAVRFDPGNPAIGPFPSDALTAADPAQRTGRRVNLPLPDCDRQPSDCSELALINQLDGFNLQPRVRVRFSAPVDTGSLRQGILIVPLSGGDPIAVNQVIYDIGTDTAFAESDAVLEPGRRYALVVTDAVRDPAGAAVEPDPGYTACLEQQPGDYCAALAQAAADLEPRLAPRRIVTLSLFTTLHASAWLEQARAQLAGSPPAAARAQPRSFFRVADLAAIAVRFQTATSPPAFDEISLPLDPTLLSGLGAVAFGSYRSPNFLDRFQAIAPAPTGAAVTLPASSTEIAFHAFLPESRKPASGYPVVIFGHGLGDSRLGGPTAVAPAFARAGLATIAINAVGHGSGPLSSLALSERNGTVTTLPMGGRGVDFNADGQIQSGEGCIVTWPVPLALRDCLRQTALDLAQLVRVIRAGLDLDGDGSPDLDPARIYYAGQSLGALYGTVFTAIEPEVRAAALNVGGGSVVDIARWSPGFRSITAEFLRNRAPALVNLPEGFNENYVLRDQAVRLNDVGGAIDIQNELENLRWLHMPGDPLAYAPLLRGRRVLWQMARGDLTVPNLATSNLVRAAGMRESSWVYRHDRARAGGLDVPGNPHTYLVLFLGFDTGGIRLPSLSAALIGLAAQQQIAGFFVSDGARIPNANDFLFGMPLFEVPDRLPDTP